MRTRPGPQSAPRLRRSWRRAMMCLPATISPYRRPAQLMEFFLAVGGPSLQVHLDGMLKDPRGQRLLVERPDLLATLSDRHALADTPEGSFGRAYLDFTAQYRFDARVFEALHDTEAMGKRLGWDDEVTYLVKRGLQLHDLWHVLGGYGPDYAGEGGNIAFTYGQLPSLAVGMGYRMLRSFSGGTPRDRWRAFLAEAVRRGRSADNLMALPYEELLARPLAEVRRETGVGSPAEAHPDGIPYSDYVYGIPGPRPKCGTNDFQEKVARAAR
ncbi:Coq4 family protein [Mycobacterium sp.]|uniref:Coq4 family protein n=1 Tax=Mycobacterium sp. TaxID=1785 RepID=UPI003BAD4FCA